MALVQWSAKADVRPSATAHIEHLRDVNLFFDFPIHLDPLIEGFNTG
jgi:hypothetical protein